MTTSSTLTVAQAAALLGRSPRFVHQLRERGYVSIDEPGQYPLVGLLRGALAYFEDRIARQAMTSGDVASTDARTREIELRIKRKATGLVPRDVAMQVLDEMVVEVSDEMRMVSKRACQDRQRRTDLDAEVARSIDRIRRLADVAKEALAAGE